MINNKDPLIAAVQKVMQDSYAERNAVKVVNEKFGVVDRRVLPRERQGEWDAAYQTVLSEGVEALNEKSDIDHPNKKKLDVASANGEKKPDGQLTSHDFKQLRSMKEEGDPRKAIRGDTVDGGSSVTTAPTEPAPVSRKSQDKLKKMIMSIKEAKKAAMCEATLESIQEEIANNLAEQAAYIFENEGQEGLDVFLESLTEEQYELLQIYESGGSGGGAKFAEAGQKAAQAAANDAKRKETTAKLNAPGAKGPNAAAGPSPAQPQIAAKKARTSDAISKMNADVSAKNKTTVVKPKPKPAKPAPKAAAPKADAPKAAAPAAPVKKSTPAQRAQINRRAERDSIGPSGKPRQLQGLGVKTGTTIKKRPIGMGREK